MTIKQAKPKHHCQREGLSIVELMIAMTLLALISVAGLKIMQLSESSFSQGRTQLNIQQKNQAITAFINDDFKNQALANTERPVTYDNAAMPADLRGDHKLDLATIFGNGSRFSFTSPKCVLLADAKPKERSFTFAPDCHVVGRQIIARLINIPLRAGAKIAFAIDGAVARCTASTPIENPGVGRAATLLVDDPNCLRLANDATKAVPKGSHILFPRFVAYEQTNPGRYFTSFFENSDKVSDGIELNMPDYLEMTGDLINPIMPIDLRTIDPNAAVDVELNVNVPLARLRLDPSGIPKNTITVFQRTATSISVSGPISHVRTILNSLTYEPAKDFYGDDTLLVNARQGVLRASGSTKLDVKFNCANEDGVAVRFDLGEIDPVTKNFIVHKYLTMISLQTELFPQQFYGYCKTGLIFDQPNGLVRRTRNQSDTKNVKLCQEADVPDNRSHPYWPFVQNSPAITEAEPHAVTVILLEQTNNNTVNRYSLVFVFDDANSGGTSKQIQIQFNNLEPERDLTDINDVYTFADDDDEYETGRINQNGSILASPRWKNAHDGFVVPLKLPLNAIGEGERYDLKFYDQRPDGSTAPTPNPNLNLISVTTINSWNIRARVKGPDGDKIKFIKVPFDAASATPKTAIQIRVTSARFCPKPQSASNNG